MDTTHRFEEAISKLYHAFHHDTLHPLSCTHCAVGNILDNKDFWKHLSDYTGSMKLNYVGLINQGLGKRFNGYSPKELLKIEKEFLKGCGFKLPLHKHTNKVKKIINNDHLFKGLEAVVSQLCKFDNLPNVMDCSRLFAYGISRKEVTSMVFE